MEQEKGRCLVGGAAIGVDEACTSPTSVQWKLSLGFGWIGIYVGN